MGGYTFAAAATALSACAAAGFESAFDSGFGLGLKKAEIGVTAGAASSAGFGPGLKKAEIVPFDIGVGVGLLVGFPTERAKAGDKAGERSVLF